MIVFMQDCLVDEIEVNKCRIKNYRIKRIGRINRILKINFSCSIVISFPSLIALRLVSAKSKVNDGNDRTIEQEKFILSYCFIHR